MAKILVVEDEHEIRNNLEILLTTEGYQVKTAENGLVALNILKSFSPDLILADIMMPVLNGVELFLKIRDDIQRQYIPFIFISAKTDSASIRESFGLGIDDYITKPYDIDTLLKAIETRLRKKDNHIESLENFKNTFIKKVPHELRTPLVGIFGFADIILHDIDLLSKEEIINIVEKIKSSGKRLHRRIEKLLVYAELLATNKLEYAESYSELKYYDIDKNIISVLVKQKANEFERIDDIEFDFEEDLLEVCPRQFEILINEILENAAKYSNCGTKIKVTGKRNNNFYKVSITDNSILQRQLDGDLISSFNQMGMENIAPEGLGLGLAIVKKIIDISQGRLFFYCDQDLNTTVEFEIPIYNANVTQN